MSISSSDNLTSPPPFAKRIIQGQGKEYYSSPEKAEEIPGGSAEHLCNHTEEGEVDLDSPVKANIDIGYDILLKCLRDHQAVPYCGSQFLLPGFPERTNSKTKSKAGNSL